MRSLHPHSHTSRTILSTLLEGVRNNWRVRIDLLINNITDRVQSTTMYLCISTYHYATRGSRSAYQCTCRAAINRTSRHYDGRHSSAQVGTIVVGVIATLVGRQRRRRCRTICDRMGSVDIMYYIVYIVGQIINTCGDRPWLFGSQVIHNFELLPHLRRKCWKSVVIKKDVCK